MEITLNGKPHPLEGIDTVAGLLKSMDVPTAFTAVELNGALLAKEELGRPLNDGDRVEIVRFVGGG